MSAVTLRMRMRMRMRMRAAAEALVRGVWAVTNAIATYPAQRAARLPPIELLGADPTTARPA